MIIGIIVVAISRAQIVFVVVPSATAQHYSGVPTSRKKMMPLVL